MIWATVSSWSYFCWLYRASPSLAANNIISLISVLTIWWCQCAESSLVLLEEGVCYDQCVLFIMCISSVQLLSRVWLFATPWITALQASLSITNSRSSLRLMFIESVMPFSHLILCHPLLLLPPIPPSIRVFILSCEYKTTEELSKYYITGKILVFIVIFKKWE